jgi:hydrogenase nickel incorporation protein HypB
MKVKVLQNILGANDQIAARNRELLDKNGVRAINIMSSPGAGKTSLILQTIKNLQGKSLAVVEGDIASTMDADKIGEEGVEVVQINTGGECHLDANMLSIALAELNLKTIDLMFIENVGNLICPAEFNLGEHRKVMILSLPEGDDKPFKYPLMFTTADVVIVNKIDLRPVLDFNLEAFSAHVQGINPDVKLFTISCKTGEGVSDWVSWLLSELKDEP